MPERENDSLEQFFQKAASKTDIPFNEEDWKKLEGRLGAAGDAGRSGIKRSGEKWIAATAVSVVILFSVFLWLNSRYGSNSTSESVDNAGQVDSGNSAPLAAASENNQNIKNENDVPAADRITKKSPVPEPAERSAASDETFSLQESPKRSAPVEHQQVDPRGEDTAHKAGHTGKSNSELTQSQYTPAGFSSSYKIAAVGDEQIHRELTTISSANAVEASAVKNKQKAIVELPGAEEVETGEAEYPVNEAHGSDKKDRVTSPRLSLLLSFAPDFSSTSISHYSVPGKAFGAMIHYHLLNRWSVSAGVVRNNKQYTGKGEEYHPPSGYWRYYTNGRIPNSVDGSCNVVEFPVMVQYTFVQNGRNKLLAGTGASSYLMLDESYKYYFDEPNPGAREGWNSRNSSRFMFNMINFTLAYEYRVTPGLLIGLEPYLKVPIEKIGWSNLKLYSTGASVTVRYVIFQKNLTVRSRGPD